MLEARGEEDLLLEGVGGSPGGEGGRGQLHDDGASEPAVASEVDAAHPTATELALEIEGGAEGGGELLVEGGGQGVIPWGQVRQVYGGYEGLPLAVQGACRR